MEIIHVTDIVLLLCEHLDQGSIQTLAQAIGPLRGDLSDMKWCFGEQARRLRAQRGAFEKMKRHRVGMADGWWYWSLLDQKL